LTPLAEGRWGAALHQRLPELFLCEDPRRTQHRELGLSRHRTRQGMKFVREQTDRIGLTSLSGTEEWHNLLGEQTQRAQHLRTGQGAKEKRADEVIRTGEAYVLLHLLLHGVG